VKRRAFITLLGGAACAWPLAARAQQLSKISRIGFLGLHGTVISDMGYAVFIDELRKLGFTEGKNLVVIDYHPPDSGPNEAFAAAVEMIRSSVELIVADGVELHLKAALAASRTIPIVFIANAYDPIARGYVTNLARPGGNITGIFQRQPDLARKRVELMREAFPEKTHLAVLWDAITSEQFEVAKQTAESLNLQLHAVKLENSPYDFEAAFRAMTDAQMLLVLSSYLFSPSRSRIAELAIRQRLPTMMSFKPYAEAGGLITFSADIPPIYRRAASFVAKILRGAKPADLPVEQPTKFELVINLKTAKAIGIELPTSILLRADEVIE